MAEEQAANSQPNSQRNPADHLRDYRFKPGESGNPSGRPRRKWLTDVADEMLEEKLSDPEYRAQYKESLWRKLLSEKVVGSMTLERVWERTEGKLTQPVDVSGEIDIVGIIEQGRKRIGEGDPK